MRKLIFIFCFVTVCDQIALAQLNLVIVGISGNTITCSKPVLLFAAGTSYTGTTTFQWTGPQTSMNSSSIAITSPGMYTISATAGTMSATQTLAIVTNTVRPLLTPGASNNGIISCAMPSVVLSGTAIPANCNFVWAGPSMFACTTSTCQAFVAGNYSVNVTDPLNGCSSSASVAVTDNRDYPVLQADKVFTVACPGAVQIYPVILSSPVNYQYEWKSDVSGGWQASNSGTIITSSPGAYTVTVTSIVTGCSSSAVIYVFACVGLVDQITDNMKIYPVPASDFLRLETMFTGTLQIRLMDTSGKTLLAGDYASGSDIGLSEMPNGLYNLAIRLDQVFFYKKIAVIH